jgi:hypothetical protein
LPFEFNLQRYIADANAFALARSDPSEDDERFSADDSSVGGGGSGSGAALLRLCGMLLVPPPPATRSESVSVRVSDELDRF